MDPPAILRSDSAPGSAARLADTAATAWRCHVAQLRFCGVYLPAALVWERHACAGWLISRSTGAQEWSAELSGDQQGLQALAFPLFQVRGEGITERDGVYLLRGQQWDAGRLQCWPQDWLCGPTAEATREALMPLDGWLRARYTGRL